jgi:Carbohydrate-binding family 9
MNNSYYKKPMNRVTQGFLFCFILFLSMPCMISGQVIDSTVLTVNRTRDFEITGDGQEAAWSDEKWQIVPKRNENGVEYQTTMKILYSDSGIYCLYYCGDSALTSALREDFSDLFKEDVVEAFFWTDEKVPMYFEYEISPYNYELPILVPNIKGNYLGWRPWRYEGLRKTRHATHVFKNKSQIVGWTAEFFIPYLLLKPMSNIPPRTGTRWRANFYRIDYDKKIPSEWSWQSTRGSFHDYERFGTLLFN